MTLLLAGGAGTTDLGPGVGICAGVLVVVAIGITIWRVRNGR
ncbi:hypothetical protein [Kitasatospora sp. NPDC088783]